MTIFLHSTALVVADQDKALDFYTRVLDWEVRVDNQMSPDYRFLVVAPKGHSSGIALGPEHIHGYAPPTPDNPRDAGIYMVMDNLLEECARLKAEGVVFHQDPEPMPWGGHGAVFADIDGNKFFVTDVQS